MDYCVILPQHLDMTAHFKIFAYVAIMIMIDPVLNTSCLADKGLQDSEQ